ncbi:unnamed protein product [Lupinus luteus]|uniref:RNase H type-1 domain-containing protein n=1 Tax=Lupinus luteus TaxID=3873 RepID=A0AAV1X4E1_LUPLU
MMAINLAHQKSWFNIWLECDSMIVVDIFNGKTNPPWQLLNKWNHCKRLLSSFTWKVSHVYREDNTCADKLANYGLSITSSTCWNNAPTFIWNDVFRNRSNLPNFRFVY